MPKQSPRAMPTLSATEVAERANSCRAGDTSTQMSVKAFTYTGKCVENTKQSAKGSVNNAACSCKWINV